MFAKSLLYLLPRGLCVNVDSLDITSADAYIRHSPFRKYLLH